VNKDSAVIKGLAELGLDVTPKEISPEIQTILDRVAEYEKEMGNSLDPTTLAKYLG